MGINPRVCRGRRAALVCIAVDHRDGVVSIELVSLHIRDIRGERQ